MKTGIANFHEYFNGTNIARANTKVIYDEQSSWTYSITVRGQAQVSLSTVSNSCLEDLESTLVIPPKQFSYILPTFPRQLAYSQ